ncbi:hypothetical protein ZIOFF_045707 [Zingiber officinale]|uniref:Uncharacterized protein n=1 Tax=Zingiber officinale TaxID=94328 RepID=A0A8J5L1I6_ZINOF|nr:hypothetical protein ZIOFF_045707 [Zingiber officinale]
MTITRKTIPEHKGGGKAKGCKLPQRSTRLPAAAVAETGRLPCLAAPPGACRVAVWLGKQVVCQIGDGGFSRMSCVDLETEALFPWQLALILSSVKGESEAIEVPIRDGVRSGEDTPIGACGSPSWASERRGSLRRFRRTSKGGSPTWGTPSSAGAEETGSISASTAAEADEAASVSGAD